MTQRDEGHNYRDSKNKAMEYEREKKYPAIIDMVIRWLDSNIDDAMNEFDPLASDSADLKQKNRISIRPKHN